MNFGELALGLIGSTTAVMFGLWAKRLDNVLGMLEKIQEDINRWVRETERRITKLEAAARYCGAAPYDDEEERGR